MRELIIVSHRERRITVHHRASSGEWSARVGITSGAVGVPSLGADLVVDEIYKGSAID